MNAKTTKHINIPYDTVPQPLAHGPAPLLDSTVFSHCCYFLFLNIGCYCLQSPLGGNSVLQFTMMSILKLLDFQSLDWKVLFLSVCMLFESSSFCLHSKIIQSD